MAANIKSVKYTDDEGNEYNVGIDAAVFAQNGAGGDPKVGLGDYTGSPTRPPMPRNLRPRVARVSNGTKKRRVICLRSDSDLFTGIETTITLTDGAGASSVYTRYAKTGENYRFARDPNG